MFRNPFTVHRQLFHLKFEARLSISSSLESLEVPHFSVNLNMLHDAVCLPSLGIVFGKLPLGSDRLNLVLLVPCIKHGLPLQCSLKLLNQFILHAFLDAVDPLLSRALIVRANLRNLSL